MAMELLLRMGGVNDHKKWDWEETCYTISNKANKACSMTDTHTHTPKYSHMGFSSIKQEGGICNRCLCQAAAFATLISLRKGQ